MNVLAVGAHYDDVELGCSGTLINHVKRGDKVTILVITDSAYTAPDGTSKSFLAVEPGIPIITPELPPAWPRPCLVPKSLRPTSPWATPGKGVIIFIPPIQSS